MKDFEFEFCIKLIQNKKFWEAVESLQLNDPSIELQIDSSAIFGQGWRVGFVGNLHMEVFGQRLGLIALKLIKSLFEVPSIWK